MRRHNFAVKESVRKLGRVDLRGAEIGIATWNVRGLNSPPEKLELLDQELLRHRIDVAGVSETWWTECDSSLSTENYEIHRSGAECENKRGVAFLVRKATGLELASCSTVVHCRLMPHRILALTIQLEELPRSLTFVQIFAPSAHKADRVYQSFLGVLHDFLAQFAEHDVVVMGSWNQPQREDWCSFHPAHDASFHSFQGVDSLVVLAGKVFRRRQLAGDHCVISDLRHDHRLRLSGRDMQLQLTGGREQRLSLSSRSDVDDKETADGLQLLGVTRAAADAGVRSFPPRHEVEIRYAAEVIGQVDKTWYGEHPGVVGLRFSPAGGAKTLTAVVQAKVTSEEDAEALHDCVVSLRDFGRNVCDTGKTLKKVNVVVMGQVCPEHLPSASFCDLVGTRNEEEGEFVVRTRMNALEYFLLKRRGAGVSVDQVAEVSGSDELVGSSHKLQAAVLRL